MKTVSIEQFNEIDLRVGKILKAEYLIDGKYSTHKLEIDLGAELGIKKSCARLINYKPEELIGRLIVVVNNFPKKQIGKNISEVLVLAGPDENNDAVLLTVDKSIPLGGRIY
ncbi:MAG: tRNA-binding protein [Candidatus Dojkabacteria bacterium]